MTMVVMMQQRRGWMIRITLILSLFLLYLPSSAPGKVPAKETERVAVDHITREHHEQLLHDAVASAEKSLQDQNQSLQSRLEASEMREISFIDKERQFDSQMEAQAKKSEGTAHRIQTLEEQRKQLSEDLKARTQELTATKNKYFDPRQDLYAANVRLREIERRANESIFSSVWSRVSSSKEVGRILHHAERSWSVIKDSAIDPIKMKLDSGLHIIKSQLFGLLSNWNSFLGGVAEPVISSEYLQPLRQYRQQMISRVDESLQTASSVIISYCMLQQNHEPSGWLHFASQYVNANSGFIVECLEVLLILLCLGTVLYVGFIFYRNIFASPKKTPETKSQSKTKKIGKPSK
jgi:small-conductance mechanosensitive channel